MVQTTSFGPLRTVDYEVKALKIRAVMWRKKMEAMKTRARTMTT
jgi:hypothetical protein